ncbi:MAG: thiamine diphosphokinase [bacterium]|nr:thiamine diphosphokinase [bacterium]
MKKAILFLNGRYASANLSHYKKLAHGRFKVAVDGGLRFFLKSNLKPNLLIGDLDSLRPAEIASLPKRKIIRFSPDKDKTDSQLAVEFCLKQEAEAIDIVMPGAGEVDHLLANFLMIPRILKRSRSRPIVRILNHNYCARWMHNETCTMKAARGDRISVLPISKLALTTRGLKYQAENLVLQPGDTASLRNLVVSGSAAVSVEGEAWLIRYHSKG